MAIHEPCHWVEVSLWNDEADVVLLLLAATSPAATAPTAPTPPASIDRCKDLRVLFDGCLFVKCRR